jgi:hypothetical protein
VGLVVPVEAASFLHRVFEWSGWNAFVAVGTLALATATFVLVRVTHRLVEQGSSEVRAQWRPVLLVRERGIDGQRLVEYTGKRLSLHVENVGQGPALEVMGGLDGFESPGAGLGRPRGAEVPLPPWTDRRGAAIAPRDVVVFDWNELGEQRDAISGSFSYTDISGGFFVTRFFCRRYNDATELVSQGIEEHPQWEPAWWQRVFPPWLVAPLTDRRNRRLYGLLPEDSGQGC